MTYWPWSVFSLVLHFSSLKKELPIQKPQQWKHNSTASNWKRNCKPNVRAPLWQKRIWHIYNIADKTPQYHIEGHSTVSWENPQTNVTRMSVVTTLWVSVTKYKTIITFIHHEQQWPAAMTLHWLHQSPNSRCPESSVPQLLPFQIPLRTFAKL
jgi:hypothetical protein